MIKLVRENDNKTILGNIFQWIEWDDEGKFKKLHDEPKIGFSCVIDPFNMSYVWLTTEVTEILEQTDELIKFKTTNSTYNLYYEN